jgi:phosphatidylglycerophosphatase A
MPLKESSDELNPAVVVPRSAVGPTKTSWAASDYLALALSTWGVGYLPLMPGTFGSLVGVGLFLLLVETTGGIVRLAAVFLSVIVISLGGIWAASRTEKLFGLKDPGKVVVDEVAGQLLALMPLAFLTRNPPALAVIVSFTLFRFFDIVKPYPAGRLEKLRGGFGIMCDDLVAGAYAALVLAVTVAIPGNPIY